MGIGTSTLLSLGSFVLAAAIGATQLIKWFQDLKDRRRLLDEAATKADAERDSIAIKGAEGAILMMQSMLDTVKLSESELRDRVRQLERDVREREALITELEYIITLLKQKLEG